MTSIRSALIVLLSIGTAVGVEAQTKPPPTPKPDQLVPIVGHVTGSGGSEFRSDLKLYNPSSTVLFGKLVFTPRNQSASIADVSVSFAISPLSVEFYEDVYAEAFPGKNGAARLKVVLNKPSGPQLVVDTSTYTATSNGGELGQSPTVSTDYFAAGVTLVGFLGKYTERTNLFVMTGKSDVTIRWQYRDRFGDDTLTVVRTYARDATFQFSASDLLGFPPAPNASLEATIQAGSARIASSPVNNITNQGRWTDFRVMP